MTIQCYDQCTILVAHEAIELRHGGRGRATRVKPGDKWWMMDTRRTQMRDGEARIARKGSTNFHVLAMEDINRYFDPEA
jgi:hypothetical protein